MKNAGDVAARAARKYVQNRRLIWIGAGVLFASVLSNFIEGAALSYALTHPPEPRYFFTDSHGRLIEATPLNLPVMSDADLLQWATRIALRVYNVDYYHYKEQLNEGVLPHMTKNGWDSMLQSWQDNHNLDELRDERLVVHGTPIGGPVFARSPLLDHGVISWQIEVPIVATFENTKGQRKQNLLLKIVVLRAPTTIHPDGLAIDALISEPYTPGA